MEIRSLWDGTGAPVAEHVTVQASVRGGALEVLVDAPFHGDPAPAGPVGSLDRLWEHEVVELFIAGDDERYLEIELGPHGHHLVLELHGRRNVVRSALPIVHEAKIEGDRWRGRALVDASYLPPLPTRMNAYAIHGTGERRRYLAWAPVPGDAPDFHRLEYFGPFSL